MYGKRKHENERTALIARTEAVLEHVKVTIGEFTEEQLNMMLHNVGTYMEEHQHNLCKEQETRNEFTAMSDYEFFIEMKKKINN